MESRRIRWFLHRKSLEMDYPNTIYDEERSKTT